MTWMGFLASGVAVAGVVVLLGDTSILQVFQNAGMLAGRLDFA